MSQKTALLTAAAVTAFVLVILGGLAARLTFEPGVATNFQPASVEAAPADAATATGVDAHTATLIALALAPNSTVQKDPELVNAQGTLAYEVTLSSGVVYVDANTGTVLGSTLNTAPTRPFGEENEHEEHDEHEHFEFEHDGHG